MSKSSTTPNWLDPKNLQNIKLCKNRYTKERGHPVLLLISCSVCKTPVMLYQKDGKGKLLRTYLDRILAPNSLTTLLKQCNFAQKNKQMQLKCPKCNQTIGLPMIYQPENRPAFRMIYGSFSRKIIKK